MNYAWDFIQSETEKYFERIIIIVIYKVLSPRLYASKSLNEKSLFQAFLVTCIFTVPSTVSSFFPVNGASFIWQYCYRVFEFKPL